MLDAFRVKRSFPLKFKKPYVETFVGFLSRNTSEHLPTIRFSTKAAMLSKYQADDTNYQPTNQLILS